MCFMITQYVDLGARFEMTASSQESALTQPNAGVRKVHNWVGPRGPSGSPAAAPEAEIYALPSKTATNSLLPHRSLENLQDNSTKCSRLFFGGSRMDPNGEVASTRQLWFGTRACTSLTAGRSAPSSGMPVPPEPQEPRPYSAEGAREPTQCTANLSGSVLGEASTGLSSVLGLSGAKFSERRHVLKNRERFRKSSSRV